MRSTAFLIAIAMLGASAPGRAAELAARFDWSVPPRFAVPTPQPEAQYEVYVDGPLHPATWHVDFDACASTGVIAQYHWSVDGAPAATVASCDGFSWEFPSEGSYTVSLVVDDGAGGEDGTTQPVVVQDLLIFGLGDSYGSGEGNPEVPIPPDAISAAQAKQTAVDAAQSAAQAALAEYQQELASFQITSAQLQDVLDALAAYQTAKAAYDAACPSLSLACVNATAALASATTTLLAKLAVVGLSNLGVDQFTSIPSAIASLQNAAQAALDLAQTSYQAAEAALAAAQAELADARAALVPVWQNRRCHRSSHAAEVQAARLIEERDPHTSVTFVHLACSGATVWQGIIGPYAGIEGGTPDFPPQLEQLGALALLDPAHPELGVHRPVDAILLSIGGNDVNFSDIIVFCMAFASCPHAPVLDSTAIAARTAQCAALSLWGGDCISYLDQLDGLQNVDATEIFRVNSPGDPNPNGLDDLPGNYALVAEGLGPPPADPGQADPAVPVHLGLGGVPVYLTQYPDITKDETGAHCGWSAGDPLAVQARNLAGISYDEMGWADSEVSVPLADTMAMSAGALGWHFVGGVAPLFGTHGYCSTQNWVVRFQDAFQVEGQPFGVAHPNAAGHAAWAPLLADAVVPEPGASVDALAGIAGVALVALGRRARAAQERR